MNKNEIMEEKLTARLQQQFISGMEKINVLYCREDLERALRALQRAPEDARPSRRKTLERMCTACGIDMNVLLTDDSLLKKIPKRSELNIELYDLVHSMFLASPSPQTAMARIVRNLAAEYEADPVRLAILKKMVAGAGFDCKTIDISGIAEWAAEHMPDGIFAEYEKEKDNAIRLHMIIDSLNDDIFDVLNSAGLDLHSELKLMIDKTVSFKKDYKIYKAEKDDNATITYNTYKITDIPLSEAALVSLKLYCEQKNIAFTDGVKTLAVLRKILRAGRYDLNDFSECFNLIQADYERWLKSIYYVSGGKYQAVFALYKYARKDERKRAARIWLPVKLADDFANGVFRTNNGQTREYLYWFAILFGMTAELKPGDVFDSEKDIVKNLFEDYYCDNLMRFFSERYSDKENLTSFEREPAGEGINYKNYVEMIYLYFMNKSEPELTPGQKIDRAQSCIEKCVYFAQKVKEYADARKIISSSEYSKKAYASAMKTVESFESNTKRKYRIAAEKEHEYASRRLSDTTYYRDDCLPEILELDEKAIPEYVYYHYLVNPKYVPAGTVPRIMISSSEQTAFDILTDTMEEVRDFSEGLRIDAETAAELKKEYGEAEPEETITTAEKTVADNMKFLHDFADGLVGRYPSENSFAILVDNIRQRIGKNIDLTAGSGTKIMAAVLQALYNANGDYLDNEVIQKKIKEAVGAVNGLNINRSIKTLQELGFVIAKREKPQKEKKAQETVSDADKEKKSKPRPEFALVQTKYEDELMANIIEYISENHLYDFDDAVYMLNDLIFLQNNISGRPTRNTMITAMAVNYMNNFDYEYRMTLPGIYKNFASEVNPALSEARFQVLSEKNIFDIFIICAIFAEAIRNYD